MKFPTVHLNGTSRGALREGYENAGRAVRAALRALQEAAPNARDYYVQGPDAYAQAEREHCARLAALQKLMAEISEILEGIADQEGGSAVSTPNERALRTADARKGEGQ